MKAARMQRSGDAAAGGASARRTGGGRTAGGGASERRRKEPEAKVKRTAKNGAGQGEKERPLRRGPSADTRVIARPTNKRRPRVAMVHKQRLGGKEKGERSFTTGRNVESYTSGRRGIGHESRRDKTPD